MNQHFKYYKFYRLQPLFLLIYGLFFGLAPIPSIRDHGWNIPVVLVLLFALYLFALGIAVYRRRKSVAAVIRVDTEQIEATFANGRCIRHKWVDLIEATKKKKNQNTTVTLAAKNGEDLVFTDGVVKFKSLMEIVGQHMEIKA